MTNKTITATKAKTSFGELIDTALVEPITITRNNRPIAIMLSPQEYERLLLLDDAYWGKKAAGAQKEGFVGKQKSSSILSELV